MSLTPHQERVADHVVRTIGSIDGIVSLRGRNPEAPSVCLLHVPATESKPFQYLVSAGLSAHRMPVPTEIREQLESEGAAPAPERVEMLIGLPPDWPVDTPSTEHAWPLRLLAELTQLPFEQEVWYMSGHTIPSFTGRSYDPSTELGCALLIEPRNLLDEAMAIPLPEGEARFLGVVPLYPREVELKREQGVKRLLERLDEERISEVFVPGREAVAGLVIDLLRGR